MKGLTERGPEVSEQCRLPAHGKRHNFNTVMFQL